MKNTTKMEKTKPSYTGNLDVALWEKVDKNGKPYFTLKIGSFANLFKLEEKKA